MDENEVDPQDQADGNRPSSLERRANTSPDLPFSNLQAPQPLQADPAPSTRWLAFVAIIAAGLLGGLVGYGIGDLLYPDSIGSAIGAIVGGLTGAGGVGVLANLTLRAMNEWTIASHPESNDTDGAANRGSSVGASGTSRRIAKRKRAADRQWSRRPSGK